MQLLSKSEDWAETAACEQTHDACMLTQGSLRANASGAFLNRVRFLCNVGLHLRCFLPSGELWSETVQHSASLTPCSLRTQTKPATAPTVHEHPQVPM